MKIYIILLSLLAFGCGGNKAQTQTNPAKYINTPNSYVKPGAAISLANTAVVLDSVDVQYDINAALKSGYFSGELQLTLSASEGLYLGGEKSRTMQLSSRNIDLPITVMANKPGRYYVYINAKVNQNNRLTGRALAFIVNIGKFDPKLTKLKSNGVVNDGVIELKAKEKITP